MMHLPGLEWAGEVKDGAVVGCATRGLFEDILILQYEVVTSGCDRNMLAEMTIQQGLVR